MKKLIFTFSIFLFSAVITSGANVPYWTSASKESFSSQFGIADIKLNRSAYLTLDLAGLKNYLVTAPIERSGVAGLKLYLPTPDGSQQEFAVFTSPIVLRAIELVPMEVLPFPTVVLLCE
jgi:hypothetical protein